jgi:hypothetical protein
VIKQRFVTTALAAGAVALAATSFAAASTRARTSPGANIVAPTPAALATVRDRVEHWLETSGFAGFRVTEVMAFTDNDYVAVNDKSGKPAFELLVGPNRSWLMEEPASMMWNTRYGMLARTSETVEPIPGLSMMMGGAGMMGSPSSWYSGGTGKVTSLNRAVAVADKWLVKARPGETAETDGRAFPGYYTMDTTRSGKTAGMVSVNAATGAVWYHGWHGTFLSERQFTS